ncbi:MAG: S8 family serine peptidase [Bacteroidetes bacterium]|nr:S8 family serine peptidase [Bacteroidota bacterium]
MMKYKIILVFFSLSFVVNAQVAPNKYRIYFTDKTNTPYSIQNPENFLSERAIQRRINQNIPIIENDLPVDPVYVDSLISLGLEILNTSKWMNTAVVFSTDTALLDTIQNLGFVSDLYKSALLYENKTTKNKFGYQIKNESFATDSFILFDYGAASNQIKMLNGHILHNQGFQGQGKIIAVIDAGFYHTDILPAFDSLWANNQIIGTRDFVDGGTVSFSGHTHGMMVLSTIGANIPGEFIGTAPKAKFWLLRSEDGATEYVIEEDNWVSAAEFADSAGVDIINTSLGYNTFNDPSQNHTYSDLDGNTTVISVGADIAASKGMLVVVSAGNSGGGSWQYVTAPADADSVLSVGAVDENEVYVGFSSTGPTPDGRIKPNVAAKGYGATIQSTGGQVSSGSGTSFASPIIAGMAACLWQANTDLTNMEILHAIEESSDQFFSPDSLKGYGVPDFAASNLVLQNIEYDDFYNENHTKTFPNPFTNQINIEFYSVDSQYINIVVVDLLGKIVKEYSVSLKLTSYNKVCLNNLQDLQNGIYFVKISTNLRSYQSKLIKVSK